MLVSACTHVFTYIALPFLLDISHTYPKQSLLFPSAVQPIFLMTSANVYYLIVCLRYFSAYTDSDIVHFPSQWGDKAIGRLEIQTCRTSSSYGKIFSCKIFLKMVAHHNKRTCLEIWLLAFWVTNLCFKFFLQNTRLCIFGLFLCFKLCWLDSCLFCLCYLMLQGEWVLCLSWPPH